MTWRFRIIRNSPGDYALHSVHLDKNGAPDAYCEGPETFAFGEATPFYGDDIQARAHMVALLKAALEDAKAAPIYEFGKLGLKEALPI